ncbi:MAG: helix-turn-helix transcriptional regulator [Patescibacteria group bacterium]
MASKKVNQGRKELGTKLKAAREKAELTQAEVASASGVNVNYYARIERGEENPSYEKLTKIMKALEIKSLDVSSKS